MEHGGFSMKKSIISIFLTLVLIITNCPVKAAGITTCKASRDNNPIVTGYDTNCDLLGETLNTIMETWLNNTSYNKLTINDSSNKAGFSSQIIFDISDNNLEFPASSVMRQWLTQAICNYPNLCVASTTYSISTITKNGHKIIQKCTFNSPVLANDIRSTIINYKKELSSLINSIPSSLSTASAKLLYLHDQIAGMGDYAEDDNNKRVFMPLGILIDGAGVCQSYSAVMNHAALAAGIPSIVVTGNNHGWNAVQANNKWYYIDVTWDDASNTNNSLIGKINHEYFLVEHSALSQNDDSTRPHAIDADFYKIFGNITDSILSSYPNAVPKSESNSFGIGRKISFLNGSWYYCDHNSIYSWDGTSEYGTKTNAASEIINCCTFEDTLYYAKSDGIYQYVNGTSDQKLDDINASNITDMIITGNTLKYVENGERKSYSLAKFSTATPMPVATATPSPSIAPTVRPTAIQTTMPTSTVVPSSVPNTTQTPTSIATPSIMPTTTQTPGAVATSPAIPSTTQTPNATVSPSADPAFTQTPAVTTTPSVTPEPENTTTSTTIPPATPTPIRSDATAAPTYTSTPNTAATMIPQVTALPEVSPQETTEPNSSSKTNSYNKLKKGSKINDQKTNAIYKVTGTSKNRTVEYVKSLKKNTANISIPATVKLKGKTYKITSIGNGAFQNNKKLTLVKIGKNVRKIGNKAFYKCKNLRYLLFKTNKLTSSNIGKKAFSGCYTKPRVKTDKSKWKQYSKILLSRGMSRKALFIIDPVKLVI